MRGEEIMAMFNDLSLTEREINLFVNRADEIVRLTNIGRFMESSIYGIAGETGCGKTTIFNLLKFPKGITKFIITITEKESKEIIIADILDKLCKLILGNGKFSNLQKKVKDILQFMRQEEIKSREKGIKVGKLVEGESKWAKTFQERYTISAIKERLNDIIVSIARMTKVVLCIDEIDKERKEDAIVILDSVKEIFKAENTSCIVALPPIMYQQYLQDRDSLFSEANLENILKDILPIGKLSDKDMEEMLNKRTGFFPDVLPQEVKKVVIKFANGNPREALLLCQNAMLSKKLGDEYKREDFILSLGEIKSEMEKFIKFRIATLKLTTREKEFLQYVSTQERLSRKEILNSDSLKMSKPTRHKIIQRLLTKEVLQEKEPNIYEVNKRVQLYYSLFEIQEI